MKLRILWLGALLLAFTAGMGACNGDSPDVKPDNPSEDGGTNGSDDGGTGGTDGGGGGGQDGGGGTDGGGGGGQDGGGGGGQDGGTVTDGGTGACVPATCGGKTYACGNCLDDDNDGKKDSADPDCLGPCHNSETNFDLGIPGGGHGNCGSIECYYDSDTGRGNDDCVYDLRCDPLEPDPACQYPPPSPDSCSGTGGTQSQTCNDVCRPLTPNGCDCFGCCTVTVPGGGTRDIFLGSQAATGSSTPCTLANSNDPAACRACTKNTTCEKPCGTCQLCLGKTELPPECTATPPSDGGVVTLPDGGTTQRCPPGEQACGLPGDPACPAGGYCLTGCCIFIQ